MNRDALKAMLIRHEALRLKPYKDSKGILTIGVGRNLEATGITEAEAMQMLDNDIARVVSYCRQAFGWFNGLDDSRQSVVASMVFNLGAAGFNEFVKMKDALAKGNFDEAANQMLLSKWSADVGVRAVELAELMKSGDTVH